jgi:hypothetical protein
LSDGHYCELDCYDVCVLKLLRCNCEFLRPNLEFLEMYVSLKLAAVQTTLCDVLFFFWRLQSSWTLAKSNCKSCPSVATVRIFSSVKDYTEWSCQPHAYLTTWRTRVSLFVWVNPFDLSLPQQQLHYPRHIFHDHTFFSCTFGTMPNRFNSKFRNTVMSLVLNLSFLLILRILFSSASLMCSEMGRRI